MKVYILTEGGKNIGLGHVTRCTSMYQAFEEIGVQPEFIVNCDESFVDVLADVNHEVFDWLSKSERLFETIAGADVVIVDSYLAGYDLYEKISNMAKTAVYFDDDLRMNYPKGVVVNGAIFAEKMPYPKREDVTYLLGARYTPLRKEFWDVSPKEIRSDVKALMLTCGGSDMHGVTPVIQKILNEAFPDLQKKLVVTSLFSNISEIKKLQDENTELLVDLNAIDFKEVMQSSDIAISSGGQTLYELASVGVPTIAVCVAENQLQNVTGWSKLEAMEYAGLQKDSDFPEELLRLLKEMLGYDKRLSLSTASKQLVDGGGAKRICDMIL